MLAYDNGTLAARYRRHHGMFRPIQRRTCCKGTVTNTAGDNAEIPVGNLRHQSRPVAQRFSTTEKDKLAGITPGADVTPDLSTYLQSGDNVW